MKKDLSLLKALPFLISGMEEQITIGASIGEDQISFTAGVSEDRRREAFPITITRMFPTVHIF